MEGATELNLWYLNWFSYLNKLSCSSSPTNVPQPLKEWNLVILAFRAIHLVF